MHVQRRRHVAGSRHGEAPHYLASLPRRRGRRGNRDARHVRRCRARRKRKRSDPRLPAGLARRGVILLRVPEGALVDRIHREQAVVAPASRRMGLRSGADDDVGFALCHLTRRIAGQPAGVADRRRGRRTGDAVARARCCRCDPSRRCPSSDDPDRVRRCPAGRLPARCAATGSRTSECRRDRCRRHPRCG